MNQKGQGNGEAIILLIIILLASAAVGYAFKGINEGNNSNIENLAANNFCKAWTNEQEFQHLKGYYKYYLNSPSEIVCQYSTDAQTFDGGTSREETKYKQFKITKENLLQWACKT